MRHEVDLRFCIWGFEDLIHSEITSKLGIEPLKIYIKGERKNPKYSAVSKNNGWIMKPLREKLASFEDQMEAMLDVIEANKDAFKFFTEKYYCEFACAVFIRDDNGESAPSVH